MYEFGVGVAFLMWLFFRVTFLIRINSTAAKNLRKVGMRYSTISGNPVAMTAEDSVTKPAWSVFKFIFISVIGLCTTLFSWGYVLLIAAQLIHAWGKKYGTPVAMKEFTWRLNNIDLTFEELAVEGAQALGRNISPEQAIEELRQDLVRRGLI
jgi:hypothetical protein